jgi:hypothetical protein
MLIEIPDDEAGLLMYALGRIEFDKRESKELRETAYKLQGLIKEQIKKNLEDKEAEPCK